MHNKQIQHSQQIHHSKNKYSKENDSKYLNAIRPYVKERKLSKRQSKNTIAYQPYENSQLNNYNYNIGLTSSKSKSRKVTDNSSRKNGYEDPMSNSKYISDVYIQLKTLKSEYKALKESYSSLQKENEILTTRQVSESRHLLSEIDRQKKQSQKYKKNITFLEGQMERLKKQCFRLIQTEKFKHKKLQETIQEKQLMIAYLRSQLAVLSGESANSNSIFLFQHTAPAYKNNDQNHNNNAKISINQSIISNNHLEIDLPRQMVIPQKERVSSNLIDIEQSLVGGDRKSKLHNRSAASKSILKEIPDVSSIKARRQYVFSNSEDSFSFSHERSKQQSIISDEQPTILTFTKKDVIVFDGQTNSDQNSQEDSLEEVQTKNKYIDQKDIEEIQEISQKNQSQDLENSNIYTGQQELPTFQNRYNAIREVNNWAEDKSEHKKDHSKKGMNKNSSNRLKHKQAVKLHSKEAENSGLKNFKVKSRPITRRPLQINTDDQGIYSSHIKEASNGDGDSSEIIKKRKNKKKVNNISHPRKRKSEQNNIKK